MPELPELTVWSRQAAHELTGKTIAAAETLQPKCLNVEPEVLAGLVTGLRVVTARERGKWMILDLAGEARGPASPGGGESAGSGRLAAHLLLNLGMGGDFYYHPSPGSPPPTGWTERVPEKYQFKLSFTDGSELALRFWWFGYVHVARAGELDRHEMTASLGPSPLDPGLDLDRFAAMVAARPRRSVKSFLMDQRILAGIGNVYVQDSLWGAGLHPDRLLGSLNHDEVASLWRSVQDVLGRSVAKGGLAFERDFLGAPGRFGGDEIGANDFAAGYRPGKPCPRCGTAIEKVRTGSTSTYICPTCQKL